MRDGWRETTLGEVVEVNPESMSTSSAPATFRYVDLSSVTPTRGIDEVELASYSLETAPGRARRIIRRGDVLVSTVRPYLRGFGYVSSSLDGEVASTGFCVLRAIPAIIESGLIWALVRTPDFVGHLMTRATGSNYPAVRSPDVASFPLLLPPLDEQRRIVDLIAAVDEAIEAAELVSSCARDSFERELAGMTTGDDLPSVALRDIARLDLDRVTVRPGDTYKVAGVLNAGRGLLERPSIDGSETNYPAMQRLRANQLVMRKLTAWEGPITVVPERFDGYFVSPEFPSFTLDQGRVIPEYLRHVCKSPALWAAMKDESTGSVQRRKRVSPARLLDICIPLPSLSDQSH